MTIKSHPFCLAASRMPSAGAWSLTCILAQEIPSFVAASLTDDNILAALNAADAS
jgi:D-serine deaminase-like pyridoxal phosphate-dependent protein